MSDAVGGLKTLFARVVLGAVRLYTRYSPIRRGRYRLYSLVAPLTRRLPRQSVVSTVDGRRLLIDWDSGMADTVYFLGEYEPAMTQLVRRIVRPGDVCLDVGANLGWYTTLLSSLCGPGGAVHAFEPVPGIFERLQHNVGLLPEAGNVRLNRMALGERSCPSVSVHVFDGVPDGHASLAKSSDGLAAQAFETPMQTLDAYLETHAVGEVAFVKLDAEGSELPILRGAERLFRQPAPPVFLIEMALATSRGFGYTPNELLDFVLQNGGFQCFEIDEVQARLTPIEQFPLGAPGAYVLCVPVGRGDRFPRAIPTGN